MSAQLPPAGAAPAADLDWRERPERSNMLMLRVMTWISLRLGRRIARFVLYGIAGYFLAANAEARKASRDYLRRIQGLRSPRDVSLVSLYRHFLSFASVTHDRVYLINDRFDMFDIHIHNEHLISGITVDNPGTFLMGAHAGSFEVLRAIGRRQPGMRVAMMMYANNAQKINAALKAINPVAVQDIVSLGQPDSMLKVHELMESGCVVGMLGDRRLNRDTTCALPFLGEPAGFPIGPFRMAAILRKPVLFMIGLYSGGNRYDIHFEKLADFSGIPAGGRAVAVQQAMVRYAMLLEQHCRMAPYNWFNFYDFWRSNEDAASAAEGVSND